MRQGVRCQVCKVLRTGILLVIGLQTNDRWTGWWNDCRIVKAFIRDRISVMAFQTRSSEFHQKIRRFKNLMGGWVGVFTLEFGFLKAPALLGG